MTEFKKGDVLAEIWNTRTYWIVKKVTADGYCIDAWFDNALHKADAQISFRSAFRSLVKVDEWDYKKRKLKGIDLD